MKSKLKLYCLFFVLTNGYSNLVFTQTIQQDSILSYQTMHVHFDKDIYLSGETIWFKAYLFSVSELSLSATNFYAAIYEENGTLIAQKHYPIIGGSCNGDFNIPDSLKSKHILFRAFTKAMISEDSLNVYEHYLSIYLPNQKLPISTNFKQEENIAFFPEGRQLVAKLENTIAVKATDADGYPLKIFGQIIELESNKVTDVFHTNIWGVGEFNFTPLPLKKYIASWKTKDGISKQTILPFIKLVGVTCHVEIVRDTLLVTIEKNVGGDSLKEIHIIAAFCNYKIFETEFSLPNKRELYSIAFPIKSFPTGFNEIILFDKDWNILQQRQVFIANDELLKPSVIISDSISTVIKGRSTIEITLSDTFLTDLSVSVVDYNFFSQNNNRTIIQDVYFNSQIIQATQNINSLLFTNKQEWTDLISLTQNFRKKNWKKFNIKEAIPQNTLDNYITLSAINVGVNEGFAKNELLNIIFQNKAGGKGFYTLKPISATTLQNDGFVFFDSVKISYQLNSNKNPNDFLIIYKTGSLPIPQKIKPFQLLTTTPTESTFKSDNEIEKFTKKNHNNYNDVQTMSEVIVKSKYINPQTARIAELDNKYTSGMFSGTTKGFQLNVIDDIDGVRSATNLKDYIRFRVPGLEFQRNTFGKIQNSASEDMTKIIPVFVPTLIFLNEVQLDPLNENPFEFIKMEDVAYVKYLPGIVIGGNFLSTSGAIYIYTKQGNEQNKLSKGLSSVYIKGYDLPNEFINFDYNGNLSKLNPDFRTTLYWNPNVLLNRNNNKYKFYFFNNDVSKKFLLKIEGVNSTGKLVYLEKILE